MRETNPSTDEIYCFSEPGILCCHLPAQMHLSKLRPAFQTGQGATPHSLSSKTSKGPNLDYCNQASSSLVPSATDRLGILDRSLTQHRASPLRPRFSPCWIIIDRGLGRAWGDLLSP